MRSAHALMGTAHGRADLQRDVHVNSMTVLAIFIIRQSSRAVQDMVRYQSHNQKTLGWRDIARWLAGADALEESRP